MVKKNDSRIELEQGVQGLRAQAEEGLMKINNGKPSLRHSKCCAGNLAVASEVTTNCGQNPVYIAGGIERGDNQYRIAVKDCFQITATRAKQRTDVAGWLKYPSLWATMHWSGYRIEIFFLTQGYQSQKE